MSTVDYGIYKIGTCDFEYTKGSFSKIVGDAIRSVYRGIRLPVNLLLGAIDGNKRKGVKSTLGSCRLR